MRTVMITVLALLGEYFVGTVLVDLLSSVDLLMFQRALWVRSLPVLLALVCAGLVFNWARR